MSFLSKETELINFIDTKKTKKSNIKTNKILSYFSKIIRESIVRPYSRLNDIFWAQECSNIVFNVFWQLFSYSNNIKLSMFMCERAILLFNEYIDLAKNTFSENSDFKINSTDVKLFIYKRTIGPIKLIKITNKKFQLKLNKIKEASIKIKYIFNKLSTTIVKILGNENLSVNVEKKLNKHLEYVEQILPNIIHKLCINDIKCDINDFVHKINLSKNIKNIIIDLNIFKIHLEIIYHIWKKKNINCENILTDKINFNGQNETKLNQFFDKKKNWTEINYYKKLVKEINK